MTFKERLNNLLVLTLTTMPRTKRLLEEIEKKKLELQREDGQLKEVQDAVRSLSHDWICLVDGHGQSGGAWFFVRNYTIKIGEHNGVVFCNAFWARELIDDLPKAEARIGAPPAVENGSTLAQPYFPGGLNRLGNLSEAMRMLCPECSEESYVLGWRELSRLDDGGEDKSPRRSSTYLLCVSCSRLLKLASRGGSR